MPSGPPVTRTLSRRESEEWLARHPIGRPAFAHRDHVDIPPVHRVDAASWIDGRPSAGAQRGALAHHPHG